MTRYTVEWDPEVESQFINDWIEGDPQTRAILTAIANWIDKSLAEDAESKGRAYPGSSGRVLSVPVVLPPAGIFVAFEVSPDDRKVRVVRIVIRGA
jgi:hypothetical protein